MSLNQYFNVEQVILTFQRCQFDSLCKFRFYRFWLQNFLVKLIPIKWSVICFTEAGAEGGEASETEGKS